MSPLGQSGGRSGRNPTASGAVRATQRQRDGIDRPADDNPVEAREPEPSPFPLRELLWGAAISILASGYVVFLVYVGVNLAR